MNRHKLIISIALGSLVTLGLLLGLNLSGKSVMASTAPIPREVLDQLSAIGQVDYTVDSNADWISAMPDDLVYDITEENFTIEIEDLKPGEHIISLRVRDNLDNTTYKTFVVNIKP